MSKTRPTTFATIAIVVSLSIFSWVQYQSLKELEDKTAAAANENLRELTQTIVTKAGNEVSLLGVKVLHGVNVIDYSRKTLSELDGRFAEIRRENPSIKDLFVIPICPCSPEERAIFSTSQGSRLIANERFNADFDVTDALENFNYAQSSSNWVDLKNDLVFWTDSSSRNAEFEVYVFHPLPQRGGRSISGLIGFTFDQVYLKEQFFPKIVNRTDDNTANTVNDMRIDLAVLGDQQKRLYGNNPEINSFDVHQPFLPAFPNWTVAASYRGTTIAEMARSSFQRNLALSFSAILLLILGMVLTLRAISLEMKLADAKATFVSNVSHELKTPLALIRLFADTLELGRISSPEKAHEYYRIINSESRRLTQLIDNILDFSQIELGRKNYQFSPANIAEVVAEVLTTYEHHFFSLGFKLNVEIEHPLPEIKVDSHAIAQVVLNLLSNAVKFSTNTRELDVVVSQDEHAVLIKIGDKGIGIAHDELGKVFEKFYRVESGLVHNTRGSGLGLSLVKHIVEAHGGQIKVESKLGVGSQFTIYLPVS